VHRKAQVQLIVPCTHTHNSGSNKQASTHRSCLQGFSCLQAKHALHNGRVHTSCGCTM
jgi:hypothetical protein